jgi:hypothetical protein
LQLQNYLKWKIVTWWGAVQNFVFLRHEQRTSNSRNLRPNAARSCSSFICLNIGIE